MAVQISGNDITVPRDGSFTRNVTIGGTLTYEDVTNIDSVGLVTARNGIEIGARPGVAASISVDGNAIFPGITTIGSHMAVGGVTPETFGGGHVTLEVAGSTTSQGGVFKTATSDSAGTGSSGTEMILFTDSAKGAITVVSSDPLTFSTANTERARITSDGKMGLGTASVDELLHIANTGGGASILIETDASSGGNILFGDDSSNTVGRVQYLHSDNSMRFNTGGSERLRIDSSGRLLLGTTTEGNESADELTISSSGNTGITVRSGTSSNGSLFFSDATSGADEYIGFVQYSHSSNLMNFGTSSTEAMRILSNQSICMGGTLQAGANGGVNIESTSSGNKPVGLSLINQGTADDSGFTISYRGKDDAGNQEDFAYLKFTAQDTANGAEDGNLEIWTAKGGTLTKSVQIGPGKPNGEPSMFVFMDSTASGASSEECLRLTNLSNTAYNWCTVSFAVNNSVQWKVGAQRHGAGGGADLLFINNGNDRFRIYENGKLRSQQTYSGTTTGGGPVYVESDGDLLRYTSSRKYKTDIETLEDARADKILDCRPVWYRSLSENDIKTPGSDKSDWGWYGFIAEEVAEIEPRLVNWATKDAGTNPDDGFASVERDPSNYTAEGVRYDNFVPLLVNLVKRQKAEIESLKARLDAAGL